LRNLGEYANAHIERNEVIENVWHPENKDMAVADRNRIPIGPQKPWGATPLTFEALTKDKEPKVVTYVVTLTVTITNPIKAIGAVPNRDVEFKDTIISYVADALFDEVAKYTMDEVLAVPVDELQAWLKTLMSPYRESHGLDISLRPRDRRICRTATADPTLSMRYRRREVASDAKKGDADAPQSPEVMCSFAEEERLRVDLVNIDTQRQLAEAKSASDFKAKAALRVQELADTKAQVEHAKEMSKQQEELHQLKLGKKSVPLLKLRLLCLVNCRTIAPRGSSRSSSDWLDDMEAEQHVGY